MAASIARINPISVQNTKRFFSSFSNDILSKFNNPLLMRNQSFINGNWISASSGKTFPVFDPSTNNEISTVADLDASDTLKAIAAASDAFPAWAARTAKDRSMLLRKLFNLMVENTTDLARIITLENGKPISEATGEVGYSASFLDWFSEEAKRIYGEIIPPNAANRRLLVLRQPVGVCSLITPWNFPSAMITRKMAPALAAGCTVVIKPAHDTPFSALALCELANNAGIPPGVINVVTCSHENSQDVGYEFSTHPAIRKISFTGSTAVGKLLTKQAADTMKRVSMELGGNAPFIVFEDADIDKAVEGALASKFRGSGQTCVCANRILVHEKVHDEFTDKFVQKVKSFKIGNGFESGVNQGPLINERAVKKVEGLVGDAVELGATVLIGGKRSDAGDNFYEPTILTGITSQMKVSHEEIFGPVAPLIKFSSEEEAIKIANSTSSGLAGYFYTRDIGRLWRVSEALQTGMVGVNEGLVSTEVAPFGGVKESGVGREGSLHGIKEYIDIKYICVGNV